MSAVAVDRRSTWLSKSSSKKQKTYTHTSIHTLYLVIPITTLIDEYIFKQSNTFKSMIDLPNYR